MTLTKSFANYLQSQGIATLGQDLFIGRAPSSNETQDDVWWILTNGGAVLRKNQTGEARKSYSIIVYRRGRNYRVVDEALHELE
jgi:hypothetical protein